MIPLPVLSDSQYKRFHSCLLTIYRRAAGNYYKVNNTITSGDRALGWQVDVIGGDAHRAAINVGDLFTDDELVEKYGFMCPRTIIRLSRFAIMYRMILKSPPHIFELVEATQHFSKGWAGALHGDLKWLATCDKFRDCSIFSLVQRK